MNAGDLIMLTTRLCVAMGEKGELSAKQLRDFLNDFGTVVGNAIKTAPCEHDGERWYRAGKTYCGFCSREVSE